MEGLTEVAQQSGVVMDYSLTSLKRALKWILSGVKVVRVPVPSTEPEWVREFHKDGLIDFPEESKYLILRAAYYLGECFTRADDKLRWAVGRSDTVEKHMPVVAGFRHEKEIAPMLVCENLIKRVRGYASPEAHIDVMVDTWTKLMP